MKLGGWIRIWIVLSIVYGMLVVLVAYNGRPALTFIHSQWFSEASDIISRAVSDAEEQQVTPFDVQDKILNKGAAGNIAWLEGVEESPKQSQRIFSEQIGELNAKYRQRISDFPRERVAYWLQALGWWLGGAALLYLMGRTIGWVVRGFRAAAA